MVDLESLDLLVYMYVNVHHRGRVVHGRLIFSSTSCCHNNLNRTVPKKFLITDKEDVVHVDGFINGLINGTGAATNTELVILEEGKGHQG